MAAEVALSSSSLGPTIADRGKARSRSELGIRGFERGRAHFLVLLFTKCRCRRVDCFQTTVTYRVLMGLLSMLELLSLLHRSM